MPPGPYSVLEECQLMCPMERDCGGKIPQVLVEYNKGGLRMVTREERARKLGIEVQTPATMALAPNPVKVEGDKFHIPPTNPDPSVYTVGRLVDILGGLCDLNRKTLDDEVKEDNPKGADLIIYTALPGTFDDEDAGIWEGLLGDDDKYPVPDKKKVTETMELAASLIARNGMVLVIAPFGCPPGWFTLPAQNAERPWRRKEKENEKNDGGETEGIEKANEAEGGGAKKEIEKQGRKLRMMGACALHVIRYEQVSIESVELPLAVIFRSSDWRVELVTM
jgi:hypothetical protein